VNRPAAWGVVLLLIVCCGRETPADRTPQAAAQPEPAGGDPFAYCAEVGTGGVQPGPEDGAVFPPALLGPMVTAGVASEEMPASVREATRWRCMDGAVWVCPMGANLPCTERADTTTMPSPAMDRFCSGSPPNADAIPAYVTGRATVYAWRCEGASAVTARQVFTPDPQGFLSEVWYRVEE
jgi:hypothetical protein